MKIETKCLHEGYKPENGGPGVMPIVQSTTYRFDSTAKIASLFDMPTECIYSRFANPTCDAVEKKIASLEGGVGAMLTSSGQAASLLSILNLCSAGDSFIAASTIYGGTINLFGVTLKKLGIECIWADAEASEEEVQKLFKPNTKAVFGETLANPALTVFDIEKWANIAHKNNVPLIVDNTFATPVLCRPIEWGADIVIHSTTKYMDGHAVQGGGVIVDGGKFDWAASGKFPDFTEPDESYHGVVYTREFGAMAYIIKARMQLMRDFGSTQSPQSAFLLNLGLESLHVRIPRHCENGLAVAKYLKNHDLISYVIYPGLEGDKYYETAKKYLPNGSCGVVSFGVKGGRKAAEAFMGHLKTAAIETHVADARTCCLHPASSTHRQMTDAELAAAGVPADMVRLSCGLENAQDLIDDIAQALEAIR
jgi:O-acetylhomoserine (thiol)-lyase